MNRVSILTYALMSADVYHRQHTTDPEDHRIRKTLGLHNWFRIDNMTNPPVFAGDLFARLYVHRDLNNHPDIAVFAYRGTLLDRLGNLESDFEIAVEDQIPGRFAKAMNFYYRAKNYLKEKYPDNHIPIRLTGHSLGGAYAQLVAIQTGNKAVTFNAPGIGNLPHISAEKHYSHQILNVNSKDGVINKVGKTIGRIDWLNVPEGVKDLTLARKYPEFGGLTSEAIGIYQQHRIKDIILTLRQDHKLASMRV